MKKILTFFLALFFVTGQVLPVALAEVAPDSGGVTVQDDNSPVILADGSEITDVTVDAATDEDSGDCTDPMTGMSDCGIVADDSGQVSDGTEVVAADDAATDEGATDEVIVDDQAANDEIATDDTEEDTLSAEDEAMCDAIEADEEELDMFLIDVTLEDDTLLVNADDTSSAVDDANTAEELQEIIDKTDSQIKTWKDAIFGKLGADGKPLNGIVGEGLLGRKTKSLASLQKAQDALTAYEARQAANGKTFAQYSTLYSYKRLAAAVASANRSLEKINASISSFNAKIEAAQAIKEAAEEKLEQINSDPSAFLDDSDTTDDTII